MHTHYNIFDDMLDKKFGKTKPPKPTLTPREMARKNRYEIESVCAKYLERPKSFGYHGSLDMFDTWSLGPIILTRDSGLMAESNYHAIITILESKPELESLWCITNCSHWAVGWVEHLSFKVYSKVLHTKVISPVVPVIKDIFDRLDNYPVLDDMDYSKREYNATIDNIDSALKWFMRQYDITLPEDITDILFTWFWDNNQGAVENEDDQGGYPNDSELESALIALGYLQDVNNTID